MDSRDNGRERCEAVEQQTVPWKPQTHAREAQTRRVARRRWWRLPWRVAAIATLGLALALPLTVQAKTFHCGAGDVQCLIDAINEANANGEQNTLRLEAGTYTLTAGSLSVTGTLTITGRRAETTIIERDPSAPPFTLLEVAAAGTLTLKRLTLRQGGFSFSPLQPLRAGGILNSGALTLIDCIVTRNLATGAGAGGIYNEGTLLVTHSTITDNRGGAQTGTGGIDNAGPRPGIPSAGTLIVTHSTIARNGASDGGGIANGGTLFVTNTTFAQNRASGIGGGLLTGGSNAVAIVQNTTFAENSSGLFPGGGISGRAIVQNTILARNTAAVGVPSDCAGPVTTLGNNLISNPTGCPITLHPSDLTGDPGLDAFTDNGRPGHGHFPLLPTSQAMDAGSDAVCPRTDQLGQRRVGPCDIGAIEFRDKDDRHHDEKDDHHDKDVAAAH